MSQPFTYSTTYELDKAHFQECFSESVVIVTSISAYKKSIALTVAGMLLVLFTAMNPYAAWFVFALGILEAVSTYYQKPWWVMRQMLSKAAKGNVDLTIDEQGIVSKSFYASLTLLWSDVQLIQNTQLGWLIRHAQGRSYISNKNLSAAAITFLTDKQAQQSKR
ncbi:MULTISPECIES: YcxB family protein [unclassified Colwellia]|uniref:YcxB family protein n=1 Tax=unclassified Colwellia TaxID=196834 RepID=UPI0015F5FF2C|nr:MULTISPECIES: YcxB family protein [unclassified Colwellia]MBA6377695.1 YcxB family protein [Colwellia sp. BRX10-7]MBA6385363.1 YcxB family protein [Colwellia sp. BRX10-2]MBA6400262.1 YcxB family protein [Colwellia sp. BRX10-5]MBA6404141.1 YcxB family protein [Colwellia sp. BRX10-1]